jgi:adenylate cyclase class 2
MEHLEIEIKFFLQDVSPIRNRIIELGADSLGRVFETNVLFEDKDKSLIQKKSLLRLRKDMKTTLTFKSQPPVKDNHVKILHELEVEVSDFSTMNRILESIGFHNAMIYEKWRETFVLQSTHFCIDTMPFGDFLEIEGPKKDIKRLASRINLEWRKRIILNYHEMFIRIKEQLNLPFSDVTFNNFKNVKVGLAQYSHFFEVGGP